MTRIEELENEIKYLEKQINEDKPNFEFFKQAAQHAIWNCERGCSGQQANEANSLSKKAEKLFEDIKRFSRRLALAKSDLSRFKNK